MSNDKHTPTFLPCPFCGSSDFIFLDHYSPDKTVTWFKIMHGAESECSITMIASSKSNLLSQWNGRSYPSELATLRTEKA